MSAPRPHSATSTPAPPAVGHRPRPQSQPATAARTTPFGVQDEGNTLLGEAHLEKLVILRMNREFMRFMSTHYNHLSKQEFKMTVVRAPKAAAPAADFTTPVKTTGGARSSEEGLATEDSPIEVIATPEGPAGQLGA